MLKCGLPVKIRQFTSMCVSQERQWPRCRDGQKQPSIANAPLLATKTHPTSGYRSANTQCAKTDKSILESQMCRCWESRHTWPLYTGACFAWLQWQRHPQCREGSAQVCAQARASTSFVVADAATGAIAVLLVRRCCKDGDGDRRRLLPVHSREADDDKHQGLRDVN